MADAKRKRAAGDEPEKGGYVRLAPSLGGEVYGREVLQGAGAHTFQAAVVRAIKGEDQRVPGACQNNSDDAGQQNNYAYAGFRSPLGTRLEILCGEKTGRRMACPALFLC